ncbi:MAG: DUF6580 family putative transport protein [Bacteroidales bacterium]
MKTIKLEPTLLAVIIMVVIGAAFRFIAPLPNFTPIAAIALFGGTYFNRKVLAFVIPFATLLISDLIIGLYDPFVMLAVYISFALIVGLGLLMQKRVKVVNIIIASLIGSIIFFLVTNFAVWASGVMPIYANNFAGLMQCYAAGLPFFKYSILGDLTYNAVLFGGLYLLVNNVKVFSKQQQEA